MTSRRAAEERYRHIRYRAYQATIQSLFETSRFEADEVELGGIAPISLQVAHAIWSGDPTRRVHWDWPQLVAHYQQNHPDRFELEVRARGSNLCARPWQAR